MLKAMVVGLTLAGFMVVPSAWGDARWYKGATHVHSLWSDGDGAPEIIADWYKSNGWDFMSFSEHNILMEGEKYVPITAEGHLKPDRVRALQERFGADWTEIEERAGTRVMRLKTLEELSTYFNDAEKFLLIPAEEMTTDGGNPHMNVLNVREVVPGAPADGDPVAKMQTYIDAIGVQQKKHGVSMLVHLDHPNWNKALTTEQIMAVRGLRFFEVYNGAGPTDRGDPALGVPTTERRWDVILSMKLRRSSRYTLYGVASDDSHRYFDFGTNNANPGRGWVMVKAEALEANALIDAMSRGDFYGSCGVVLSDITRGESHLGLTIAAEDGVTYTTRYIGTRKGFDSKTTVMLDDGGAPLPNASLLYSDEIGVVLHESRELTSTYSCVGDELYVRATVTSDKPMANPPVSGDVEMAWVQPIILK